MGAYTYVSTRCCISYSAVTLFGFRANLIHTWSWIDISDQRSLPKEAERRPSLPPSR